MSDPPPPPQSTAAPGPNAAAPGPLPATTPQVQEITTSASPTSPTHPPPPAPEVPPAIGSTAQGRATLKLKRLVLRGTGLYLWTLAGAYAAWIFGVILDSKWLRDRAWGVVAPIRYLLDHPMLSRVPSTTLRIWTFRMDRSRNANRFVLWSEG